MIEDDRSPPGGLAPSLAARMLEHLARAEHPVGHRLTAQGLADAMGVSRTPIHRALRLLEEQGAVGSSPNRGFHVALPGAKLRRLALPEAPASDEDTYLRLAEDRLRGELGDVVSESELMERYALSRLQVQRALNRMGREGLVDRKAGRGWSFRPALSTVESHRESYRFRMALEPAALLEPTFRIDKAAFERVHREQLQLLDGAIERWSPSERFRASAEFHEAIVACSGNRFFVDALRQVNQLRRILEYRLQTRSAADRARLYRQCEEHLELLDLIEGGDRVEASHRLRRHLDVVSAIKTGATGGKAQSRSAAARSGIEVHL